MYIFADRSCFFILKVLTVNCTNCFSDALRRDVQVIKNVVITKITLIV